MGEGGGEGGGSDAPTSILPRNGGGRKKAWDYYHKKTKL